MHACRPLWSAEALPPTVLLNAPRMVRKKKSRRIRWLLLAIVPVAILFWFLPALLARTPLFTWAVSAATADLNGQLRAESASLGWLSSVRLAGLTLHDAHGSPVLEAATVETERSLLGLIFSGRRLGTVRIIEPRLAVTLRAGGSNVEDVLAEYLKPSEKASELPQLRMEVIDGEVAVTDAEHARSWQVRDWQLLLDMPAGATTSADAAPFELSTSGLLEDPRTPGDFSFAARLPLAAWLTLPIWDLAAGEAGTAAEDTAEAASTTALPPLPPIEAKLESKAVPLAMFQPLWRRLCGDGELSGQFGGRLNVSIGVAGTETPQATPGSDAEAVTASINAGEPTAESRPAEPAASVRCELEMNELRLATSRMGTDQVQLDQVRLDCRADGTPRRWGIDHAALRTDLGELNLDGTLDLRDLLTAPDWHRRLRQTVRLQGTIDLAQLAALLPSTLRVRPGTRVTSGQVSLNVRSHHDAEGVNWQGRLETSDLAAVDRGRPISWPRPVLVTASVRQVRGVPYGLVVDKLRCQSEFLTLDAVGGPARLAADATFDLARLARQLGQFVDLGSLQLAGEGWAHLNWQLDAEDYFQADAELHVAQLAVVLPDRPPWREQNLVAIGAARGVSRAGQITRLDEATFHAQAGADRLDLRLREPATDVRPDRQWPLALSAEGELANWPSRLAMFADLSAYRPAGRYQAAAELDVSPEVVRVEKSTVEIEPLRLAVAGLNIDERRARVELVGGWRRDQGEVALDHALLQAVSLAAESRDLRVRLPGGNNQRTSTHTSGNDATPVVRQVSNDATPGATADGAGSPLAISGTVAFSGVLAEMQRWLHPPQSPPSWQMSGQLTGRATFEQSAARTTGRLAATLGNLRITGSQDSAPFYERRVELTADGTYDAVKSTVTLANYEVRAETLSSQGRALVELGPPVPRIDFDGRWQYDMARLSALAEPYIGSGILLAGRGDSPLKLHGPLDPAALSGGAEAQWQRGDVYGFLLGPATVTAKLGDGLVRMQPLEMDVSQGKLRLGLDRNLANC